MGLSNYPTSLDSWTNKVDSSDDVLAAHVNKLQDAIYGLEVKVGADSSGTATSLDYLVKNASSSNPGHKHTLAQGATDVTASAAELNYLDGSSAGVAVANKALVLGASKNVDQLTITTMTGNVVGNVTGNCSGSSGSCTGNAATASACTGNAATASAIVAGGISAASFPAPTAGDYYLISCSVVATTSESYTLCAQFYCPKAGAIRTRIGLKSSTGGSVYARIYKNGVAVGTQRSATTTSYQYYNEDFNVAASDLIQLYMYQSSAGVAYGYLIIGIGNPWFLSPRISDI